MVGVKIWKWTEFEEVERIQERHLKWTLGLDRKTSWVYSERRNEREIFASRSG